LPSSWSSTFASAGSCSTSSSPPSSTSSGPASSSLLPAALCCFLLPRAALYCSAYVLLLICCSACCNVCCYRLPHAAADPRHCLSHTAAPTRNRGGDACTARGARRPGGSEATAAEKIALKTAKEKESRCGGGEWRVARGWGVERGSRPPVPRDPACQGRHGPGPGACRPAPCALADAAAPGAAAGARCCCRCQVLLQVPGAPRVGCTRRGSWRAPAGGAWRRCGCRAAVACAPPAASAGTVLDSRRVKRSRRAD
jgi:hypothetical protein